MFVLRISDDRLTLRFASVHMEVLCGGRVAEAMGTTFTIARRAPNDLQGRFVNAQRASGRLALSATTYENPRTCSTTATWSAVSG